MAAESKGAGPMSLVEKALTPIPFTDKNRRRNCNVPQCSRSGNQPLSTFGIPLSMGVRKRWLDACHFHDSIRDLKRPRVCQNHFYDDQMVIKNDGRRFLKKGIVPCRNLPDESRCAHCFKKGEGTDDDSAAFLQQEVVPARRTIFGVEEADEDDDWEWIPKTPLGEKVVRCFPALHWPERWRKRARKIKSGSNLTPLPSQTHVLHQCADFGLEVGRNVTANRREKLPAPEPRSPAECPLYESFQLLHPAKRGSGSYPAIDPGDHDYLDNKEFANDFTPQDDEDILTPGRAKELFCKKLEEMKAKGVPEKDLDALFEIFIQSYKTCKRQEKHIRSNHFVVTRAKAGKLTKAMREELIEKHFNKTHTLGQIEILKKGLKRPAKWTQEDLDLGRSIRNLAPNAYETLRKNNKSFPLPSQKCIMDPAPERTNCVQVKKKKAKNRKKKLGLINRSGKMKRGSKKKSKLNENDIQKLINSLTPAPVTHFQPQDEVDEDETYGATSYIQSVPYALNNQVIRTTVGTTVYHYSTIDNYPYN